MPAICEITRFVSSSAYRADPSVLHAAYNILHGVKGLQATYHGLQIGDDKILYGFTIWESIEHHKAFISNKPAYSKFVSVLQRSIGGPATLLVHVYFSSDPYLHLNTPPVEVVYVTLQADADIDADEMRSHLTSSAHASGSSWGQTVEDDATFVILAGSGLGKTPIDFREGTMDCEIVRIALSEYRPQAARLSLL